MNIYYFWLLLLVVLSTYTEGPQLTKPLDTSVVIASPLEYSTPLGILALGLPQNEVLDLGISIPAPLWVYLAPELPQNEVLQNLPQNGVLKSVPAYKIDNLSMRVQNMTPEMGSMLRIVVATVV